MFRVRQDQQGVKESRDICAQDRWTLSRNLPVNDLRASLATSALWRMDDGYTMGRMTGVKEPAFDWDDANVAHIARHAVTPAEAEQVILVAPHSRFRPRSAAARRDTPSWAKPLERGCS